MQKKVSLGIAGVTALAIAGNFIVALPLTSDDGSDIFGALLAVAASFLLFLLLYPPVSRLYSLDTARLKRLGRLLYGGFLILSMGIILIITLRTVLDFADFTAEIVLPKVSLALILPLVLLPPVFIASKSFKAFSKLGVVLFAIGFLLSVIIFLLSLSDMSLKYVTPRASFKLKEMLKVGVTVFVSSFSEAFLLISAVSGGKNGTKSVLLGNLGGALLVILCSLNTLLVFGGGFANTISYPYVAAVRAVGRGDVFSGMEGFLYVSIFFCCSVKSALGFYGIKTLAHKIRGLKNFN